MKFRFQAKVVPSGNATAVEVPKDGIESFGAGARPPVAISINDHRWRSRIAVMNGKCLVGISAANRRESGIAEGDLVDVLIELDEEPRTLPEPKDLSEALRKIKAPEPPLIVCRLGSNGSTLQRLKMPSLLRRGSVASPLVNELQQSSA
jgi:hypothetical protein